jgi:hypothetical protein
MARDRRDSGPSFTVSEGHNLKESKVAVLFACMQSIVHDLVFEKPDLHERVPDCRPACRVSHEKDAATMRSLVDSRPSRTVATRHAREDGAPVDVVFRDTACARGFLWCGSRSESVHLTDRARRRLCVRRPSPTAGLQRRCQGAWGRRRA